MQEENNVFESLSVIKYTEPFQKEVHEPSHLNSKVLHQQFEKERLSTKFKFSKKENIYVAPRHVIVKSRG